MRILPIASIAGVLLLYGCSTNGTNSSAASSNSDMQQSIKTQLSSDPQLQGIAVDAKADKNEVTLSGTVLTEDLRTRAVDLAKNGRPNLVVTDKIDVQPREVARNEYTEDMARTAREKAKEFGDKIGNSLDDAWIHTKIKAKLIDNPDTPSRKINIDVIDQVVTLHGQVDTIAAKDEAERTAKQTEGVKRVNNLLKIQAG
jgi:osmotically-inducible protein OsmY